MSQNTSLNETSLSDDDDVTKTSEIKSIHSNYDDVQNDLTVVNNGWANFENNSNLETIPVTEDDWADFQSNTEQSDEDIFGDGRTLSTNPSNTEQIESLISTCFPLEPSTLSTDIDDLITFELPTFTTFKEQNRQLPCFQHSLSLWNLLSNVSNDLLGVQYQWRKSNTERLFHQALGVHERLQTKTTLISEISQPEVLNVENENEVIPVENPSTDFHANKRLDLDSDILPLQTSKSNKEEHITSSTTIHRNNSPVLQQHSAPIKTIDLFPGSTTVVADDVKPVSDSMPSISSMNPKALMFPT